MARSQCGVARGPARGPRGGVRASRQTTGSCNKDFSVWPAPFKSQRREKALAVCPVSPGCPLDLPLAP